MIQYNLEFLCDYYELTMSNGYLANGYRDKITYFDMFFRSIPDEGGFAIAAGLEQVLDYVENLRFSEEDIEFLRSKKLFGEDFLSYLKSFRFSGDIWAVPEGTPVFPHEPMLTVRAPAIEAQLLETYILMELNHQSLIATKANRMVRAAQGRAILEFGSRRAHGADAAVLGARAAYIGGCAGTACTLSDQLYGIPAGGTMAHSWVEMFDSEYDAFAAYCRMYPQNTTLLVDTYNTLLSGVPNAVRAFKDVLVPMGIDSFAIRIDSGDLAYLTKRARAMLDEAGLKSSRIVATGSLDEYLIRDLLQQGAEIDVFGVGERLITSKSSPVFDGVYKLAAVEEGGAIVPKIKISDNTAKITNPHFKKVCRLFDNKSGKALADQIVLHDEVVKPGGPVTLFDPDAPWKKKVLTDFTPRELQVPVFKNGVRVYDGPPVGEIRAYCAGQVGLLWDEVKRFDNPHKYYVDLSERLWTVKKELLEAHR
jgi:nicotinate phosphoribosyltransferase